ncbi:MAG: UDP-N-acetylmuramate dehydrogenase [Acidobacteriota bacterium]|nr:UDP-N-acetylmuramate dehydrogenase [Acidobacteriota bacterium]MDE3043718.1 UDP-N-acetylmuramate dehydrogenase [Acidobacteriota bacterium]MDE3107141.1 UDP-N-acetylmuramate dehydrogenase [Acidobacteriota bacterium]
MMNLDALHDLGAPLVAFDAPLGARTTYRVGGSVRALVTLRGVRDLERASDALKELAPPFIAVGNGSNLLVNDGLHDVVVVVLEGEFAELRWTREDGRPIVTLGGGVALPTAARRLVNEGVVGFEWAVGVPGTLGGAVAMNAGGHGSDMARHVLDVRRWRDGRIETVPAAALALGYRTSALRDGDLVLEARLALDVGNVVQAKERLSEIVRWRRAHQPGGHNAGSVFRNPPGDAAARLIESVGAKGLRWRSAMVSEKHANFIQADPDGHAFDVYELMGVVRQRVFEGTGVLLERENRLLGFEEGP